MKLANICQLQKTAEILPRQRRFLQEMTSEKRVRKSHTDDATQIWIVCRAAGLAA